MDHRRKLIAGLATLGLLAGNTGCGTFGHRATVPAQPKSARFGGGGANAAANTNPVAFGSDPSPVAGGVIRPQGPVINSAGPTSSMGGFGGAPGAQQEERTSMPVDAPASSPLSPGADGRAPSANPFQ